jgi:putative DNA primase/helicase
MSAQPSMPSPILAAALAYAGRGWRVFPLQPGQKIPFKGTRGVLDATTDEAQIRDWWKRWPRANVGIAGGFGLVLVDEDTYKGGDAGTLMLPVTLSVRTPRGGVHHYFAYEGPLGNAVEGKLAPGVGFRGQGYYVVAPPSTFNGQPYAWMDQHQPVAMLPERIARMIRGEDTPAKRVENIPHSIPRQQNQRESDGMYWADRAAERARGEGRNNAGTWLAAQLRDNGCADGEGAMLYYASMVRDWETPIYTDREALATWRSVNSRPAREPARSQSNVTPMRRDRTAKRAQNITEPITDGANALDTGGGEPPNIDEVLLKGEPDDNGNAEAMWRLYGHEFLFTPAIGWLRWTGTHWTDVPEPIVQQKAISALKRRRHAAVEANMESIIKATKQDKARVTGCLALFKSYVIEPDVSTFDADTDALNCQNGVLNLKTGTLTPHSPKQRFTYCLGIPWNPKADKEPWAPFLLDALGNDRQAADYFQMCAGYTLTGHTREEKAFYLYGPSRAGKGTVTETLLQLLPRPLGVEVDFSTFTAKRDSDSQNFDLAELKPARMVVASESNRSQALNTAKIKQLTGGNWTRCAFKHRDMFSYRPQYKVWLVSNWEVKADADDTAAWGRLQVFHFPNSHLGREDLTLKQRMRSPEVLQGVLRWAVEGTQRWYEAGRLDPPESVKLATVAQRDSQDYVKQWIDDCCLVGTEYWAQSGALMRSYTAWCEANNVHARTLADLVDTLVRRFNCTAKRQAHTGQRGFKGIGFKALEGDR